LKSRNFLKSSPGTSGEIGHGIGLNLLYQIFERLETELEVESELGKGSRFYYKIKKARINSPIQELVLN
jgi:signal transduction histidine kinase